MLSCDTLHLTNPMKFQGSNETGDGGSSGESRKGAEGVRRKPNLSGKRTEESINSICFSFYSGAAEIYFGSIFIFGGIENGRSIVSGAECVA